MDVPAAMRRLDARHAAPAGRSFELFLRHGTADESGDRGGIRPGDRAAHGCECGSARTRIALAAGCFAFHARGAPAAANLLEQKAALLLPSKQAARHSASGQRIAPSLPSPTSLSEPELALRLLLALARSAEPAVAAVNLAAVLHRHGMHAAGRAAPGGSGATHVHVLPFGVTARAVELSQPVGAFTCGYSGGSDVPSAGFFPLLSNKGATGWFSLSPSPGGSATQPNQLVTGSGGHGDGHAASMLSRLHLHMAAGALAANGSAGARGYSVPATSATFDSAAHDVAAASGLRAACAPCTRQPLLTNRGSERAGIGPATKTPQHPGRRIAPGHSIVPAAREEPAARHIARWQVPETPSLALARAPPPRGLKPPPLPDAARARVGLVLSLAEGAGVPSLAGGVPVAVECSTLTASIGGRTPNCNLLTGMEVQSSERGYAKAAANVGGVRPPLGLAREDGSETAAARGLLLCLQGLGTVVHCGAQPSALGSSVHGNACGSDAGDTASKDGRALGLEATFKRTASSAPRLVSSAANTASAQAHAFAPRSLFLAASAASAQAVALASVAELLRRGGWDAVGTALGAAVGARLVACARCIGDVPELIRERSLPPQLNMEHSHAGMAKGSGPRGGQGACLHRNGGAASVESGWALTLLSAATHARGAADEHARLASILITAFKHAGRAVCRSEAGETAFEHAGRAGHPSGQGGAAVEHAGIAACEAEVSFSGPASSSTATASAAHLHSTSSTGDGMRHSSTSSSTAAASTAHLHSTPPTGDGMLLLEGLYVQMSSPSLLAVPTERALCFALFRAAARPWLESLAACAFAAQKNVFDGAGGDFTSGGVDGYIASAFTPRVDDVFTARGAFPARTVPVSHPSATGSARVLPSSGLCSPSLPLHAGAVAQECAACVLLLLTSAAARRYTDLILHICGAGAVELPADPSAAAEDNTEGATHQAGLPATFSSSTADHAKETKQEAVACALTLPPPGQCALAAARAEWSRRFACGEAALRQIKIMYDSYDSSSGAVAAAEAAERTAQVELERALEAAWEERAVVATREAQRAVRVALAGQLEEKARRQAERAAAEAAELREAAEVARLAGEEVEIRKAALVARFEEQMRGAERRARMARWRAARARGTPGRTDALRRALTPVAEEGTGRALFGLGGSRAADYGGEEGEEGAGKVLFGVGDNPGTGLAESEGEEGARRMLFGVGDSRAADWGGEEGEQGEEEATRGERSGGAQVVAATPRDFEAASGAAAGGSAEGGRRLLQASVSSSAMVGFGATVNTQQADQEEGAALAARATEASAAEAETLASEEAAAEAEAATEAAAIESAQRAAEMAEKAQDVAGRLLSAAEAAAGEGAVRVERAQAELLKARRALEAVGSTSLTEKVTAGNSSLAGGSQQQAVGISVQAHAEGWPAAGQRVEERALNSSFKPLRAGGVSGRIPAGLAGGAAAGRALAVSRATVQQSTPMPLDRDTAALVAPHETIEPHEGIEPSEAMLTPEGIERPGAVESIQALKTSAATEAEAVEPPVNLLLEEFVLRPLQGARSILGRTSVLYLRRECRLLPWLASLRRFLLAGDGDLMDALAMELHAALASGLIDAEIAAGQTEFARGSGAAAGESSGGGKSSFALQRALDLALSRAEIKISATEIDCTTALRLRWTSQPPTAAVCAPAVPASATPSPGPPAGMAGLARAGTAGGSAAGPPPSLEAGSSSSPLHRIDALDGFSLTLELPPTLARLLDTGVYAGVFSFGLRIKRATLAHRSLCSLIGRTVSRSAIPSDARHKLSLHTYSLGQLLRSFEQHALGSDEEWSALSSAVARAASPVDIRAAHSAFVAGVASRCCASDAGLSAVVSAVLGLALALNRDVAARIRAGPPPKGAGAGTVAAWGAVWRKMIDASRRQLALLCNALASSGSGFAPLVAAAFPAS